MWYDTLYLHLYIYTTTIMYASTVKEYMHSQQPTKKAYRIVVTQTISDVTHVFRQRNDMPPADSSLIGA